MPIGASSYPRSLLPDSHWRALYAAAAMLVDLLCQDLISLESGTSFAELAIADYLPRPMLPRYAPLFLRQFLVVSISVGLKLRLPDFHSLASVAEELALFVLIQHAEVLLDLEQEQADFSTWTDIVFEDTDFELLYRPRFDGVWDTAIGRDFGMANLRFEDWFTPFQRGTALHPNVALGMPDLWQEDHSLYPPAADDEPGETK